MDRFNRYARIVSRNHTRTAWVLKCDIKKFFASIDHGILKDILRQRINNENILWLLAEIIDSFQTADSPRIGLPLGNLTSQLLVNIYMNEFDQFIKRELREKYYIRYADDFVILSKSKIWLEQQLPNIAAYLTNQLKLSLHPRKVSIRTFASGVDFLGWVHFPHRRVLRTATRWRMAKRLEYHPSDETIDSYRGLLSHGNTRRLKQKFSFLL